MSQSSFFHNCHLLQGDLSNLSLRSQQWNLQFNGMKCVLLQIGSNSSLVSHDYLINNTSIQALNCRRDLGIMISSDLNWSDHLKLIASRAYKALGLIRRLFSSSLDIKSKKNLYLSLIRSQLTYGSVIWRPHFISDIIILEHIQRRATKYILNDYHSVW